MKLEELHEEVDRVVARTSGLRGGKRLRNEHQVVVAHALIDFGLLTKIECQSDDCLLPSREFGDLPYMRPSIDHVRPVSLGGAHRVQNLRLVHRRCNRTGKQGGV